MRRVSTLKSQCLLYTVFPTASPSSSSASLHGGDGLRSMVAAPQPGGDSEAAAARPERRPRLHSAPCPPAGGTAPGTAPGSHRDVPGSHRPIPAHPGPPLNRRPHPRSRSTRGSQLNPLAAPVTPRPRPAAPRPGRKDARSEGNGSQEEFFIRLYRGRCERSGVLC